MNTETKMFEEAKDLLMNVGVKSSNEWVNSTLEATGLAAFDETTGRVHIMPELVDSCLAMVPNNWGVPMGSLGGGGTAPYRYDKVDGWVAPAVEDMETVYNLSERNTIPFTFRGLGPQHNAEVDVEQVGVADKTYGGFKYWYVASEEGVMAVCDHRDKYPMKRDFCTTHSILTSPMMLNDAGPNIPIYKRCVEEGLPIYLVTMPISGVNSPATMYGCVLTALTDFLFGMVLTQTLSPGHSMVMAAYPMWATPASDYQCIFASKEQTVMSLWTGKLGIHMGIPSIGSSCSNDAQTLEEALSTEERDKWRANVSYLIKHRAEFHQNRHTFGFLHNQLAYSLELAKHDMRELNDMLMHIQPLKVEEFPELTYDEDAMVALTECAPTGNFMEHWTTLKNV